MNGKALSEALGALPEDMVAEAMESAVKRHIPWLRLAACFAVIVGLFFGMTPAEDGVVTAPGILTVEVRAVDENGEYIWSQLQEGIDHGWTNVWPLGISVFPGIPVRLFLKAEEFANEDISFLIMPDKGGYCELADGEMVINPSQFTMDNGSICFWNWHYGSTVNGHSVYDAESFDRIYTDIIIYSGEHIIGFAVLLFEYIPESEQTYKTSMVSSVLFPKLEGKYQNVSSDYVHICLSEVKHS